jgi:hypothetical protein
MSALDGARLKIERARELLDAIDEAVNAFLDEHALPVRTYPTVSCEHRRLSSLKRASSSASAARPPG